MRLFVAAVLPEEMLEALAETSSLLRASVRGRYVSPDSFHVTFAFLGEVAPHRVDDAVEALEEACRGFAPFSARLGELGKFGKRTSATLWQGFSDKGSFVELAESVRRELDRASFEFDHKTFLPHVTLMRAANLATGELPTPMSAKGEIAEVSLFRSDLSGERPRYEALNIIELQG